MVLIGAALAVVWRMIPIKGEGASASGSGGAAVTA